MTNNEKLEQLAQQIDKSGLSAQDVVSYLLKTGRLKPDDSETDVSEISPQETSSPEYEMPSKILPGMYVYADGLIYPEIIQGRQIKAVAGYVDGSEVFAVCLKANVLPLLSNNDCKLTAAQWCSNYAEDGVKCGEAFLPSIDLLEKLYTFREAIDTALQTLGETRFHSGNWSSTDKDYAHAWGVNFVNGERHSFDKRSFGYVRPVIAIKI